jgi:plasmid maintenance system antidote protein VapI
MSTHKDYTLKDLAESYIFPDVVKGKDRDNILDAFRRFRKEKADSQSSESKSKNRLLQLKFLMEDYLLSSRFEAQYDFGFFLHQYIDCLGMNYTDFAKNIDIGASTLSQIIGKHRKPTDKIILRLYIHSNYNFPLSLWYRLLEKEKINQLENNKSILENESKYVKHTLDFHLYE